MGSDDRRWMLPLLDLLFDDYTDTAAIRLLRDPVARSAVAPLLTDALARIGHPAVDLESEHGDNLLQGLLAHRTRFDRERAQEKVARNIALAGGER